jgi:hypothetical protein
MLTLPDSLLPNEISSAAVRVAALIEFVRLRDELKSAAVTLLADFNDDSINRLERLIRLGETIGEIKLINSQVLLRELNRLRSDINSANKKTRPDIDLEREFARRRRPEPGQLGQNIAKELGHSANKEPNDNGRVEGENSAAVLNFIEKNPQCQFKVLRFAFPAISERTLRRIVDRLIQNQSILRIGNPGPTSFYQTQKAQAPVFLPTEKTEPENKLSTPGNPPSVIAL